MSLKREMNPPKPNLFEQALERGGYYQNMKKPLHNPLRAQGLKNES